MLPFVSCPAHRKNIPAASCSGCDHSATLVGCKHFSRAVPIEFCMRVCPMQKGARGPADAVTGKADILGTILAPLAGGMPSALCGAPWVLAQWGAPRSIFAGGATPPIEDPRTNVAPACAFPRALSFGATETATPTRLEV